MKLILSPLCSSRNFLSMTVFLTQYTKSKLWVPFRIFSLTLMESGQIGVVQDANVVDHGVPASETTLAHKTVELRCLSTLRLMSLHVSLMCIAAATLWAWIFVVLNENIWK